MVEGITKEELDKRDAAIAALTKKIEAMEAENAALKKAAEEAKAPKKEANADGQAQPKDEAAKEAAKMLDEQRKLLAEAKKERSAALLENKLAKWGLPQVYTDHARKQFADRVFESADLDAFEKSMRELYAANTDSGKVTGHGPNVKLTNQKTIEGFYQKAVDLCFDDSLHFDAAYKDIPHLRLSQIYQDLTGDVNYRGMFDRGLVQEASATQATMAELTRNVLNKILMKGYQARPKWWEAIVTPHSQDNLQTVSMIRPKELGMIDEVSEGAAYVEKIWDDVRETASFAKYGNYVGVTMEAIINDDVRGVAQLARILGTAAWKRVSYQVAYLFTQASGLGPTLNQDNTAWFDAAGHANYNATGSALSYSSLITAEKSLYEQTDDNGTAGQDEIGMEFKYMLIPIELRGVAEELRDSANRPDNADNGNNRFKGRFTPIVVPNWTDANNWVIMVAPSDIEIISQFWYRGQREPELFQANDPQGGAMFTNDEIRYKVRFWHAVGVSDFRGIYKVAVA